MYIARHCDAVMLHRTTGHDVFMQFMQETVTPLLYRDLLCIMSLLFDLMFDVSQINRTRHPVKLGNCELTYRLEVQYVTSLRIQEQYTVPFLASPTIIMAIMSPAWSCNREAGSGVG